MIFRGAPGGKCRTEERGYVDHRIQDSTREVNGYIEEDMPRRVSYQEQGMLESAVKSSTGVVYRTLGDWTLRFETHEHSNQ